MMVKRQARRGFPSVSTPAFLYDENSILSSIGFLHRIKQRTGCKLLFSLKSFAVKDALRLMTDRVDGFAVSSLFEAMLARELINHNGTLHITTGGLGPADVAEIIRTCDYITLNSLSQWGRFRNRFSECVHCGLRINPHLSMVRDDRYDPCRKHSKLGIPLDSLIEAFRNESSWLAGINGLHFHTNSDSSDFSQLLRTVEHIDASLSDLLSRLSWINLGGGYIFDEAKSLDPFYEAVDLLRSKYGLEVFIEPGASIVRKAGYLVSTVLDLFNSDGKEIAILDTTVNHMPEVFEYQFRPDVVGHVDGAAYQYILAGCSCLAGDLFGEYSFEEPLEVGSRVVFSDAGAYTLAKAHMFNGINLPTIYALKENGELEMKKRFTYEDFANRCGVDTNVFV